MPILSVLATLLKSRFFVIYYRCVTLANEKPPLCKGRWPSGSEVGGIVNPPVFLLRKNPAPFTQGGLLCYNIPTKVGNPYAQNSLRLPWQDLSQARHTKLCNAIPPFATGLPHLYYSLTTLQNNHICPNMTKITAADQMVGGCFCFRIDTQGHLLLTE